MSVMLHPHVAAACSPNNSTFPDEEYFSQFILPYDGYLFPFETKPKEKITHFFGWLKKLRICGLIVIGAYVLAIFVLKKFYMKHREPFRLQTLASLWYAALSVFNLFCSWRTFMDLFLIIKNYGFHSSVCTRLRYELVDIWHILFLISKFVELGDPFFVVLTKRSLSVRHVIHHGFTVFACCILKEDFSIGRWIVVINAFVLSCWYFQGTLRTVNLPVPSYFRKTMISLTAAESLIFVLWILPYILYAKIMKIPCLISNESTIGSIVCTISLAYIVNKFLYDKYLRELSEKKLM